jgi:hypothetical protein
MRRAAPLYKDVKGGFSLFQQQVHLPRFISPFAIEKSPTLNLQEVL